MVIELYNGPCHNSFIAGHMASRPIRFSREDTRWLEYASLNASLSVTADKHWFERLTLTGRFIWFTIFELLLLILKNVCCSLY